MAEGWWLFFEHDAAVVSGVPVLEGKDVVLREVVEAPTALARAR